MSGLRVAILVVLEKRAGGGKLLIRTGMYYLCTSTDIWRADFCEEIDP